MPEEKKHVPNEALRRARIERGWTQPKLAQELGGGESTVRSWESGHHPGLESRRRLCELFGMTAAELGFEKNEKEQLPREGEQTASIPVEQDSNRRSMLKRVQTCWVSGILDHSLSLYQGSPISVSLRTCPGAVINPWGTIAQESNLPSRPLAPQTHILEMYDEADGGLLILGEPGAGKTTLLLELARDLIERARLDETHPLPVVFNLTSWAEEQSAFSLWLIDELHSKYQVPYQLAQTWVAESRILPLLDGLDEVAETYRRECIQAINSYRKERGFLPMVVCCRANEYLALNGRIALNNAVTIEPLGWEEIECYVSKGGKNLREVQRALQNDAGLREMASTPLMLHIIAHAFRVNSIDTLLSVQDESQRRALIFEKYVEIVLKRRGPTNRYPQEQTIHWLSWLARQMQKHNQTEFYLDRLQQDWLPDTSRNQYNHTLFRIIYGIETVVIAGLFAWLRGGKVGNISGVSTGLLGWLGASPGNSVLGWMAPGLGGGLEGGGMLGLIFLLTVILTTMIIDSYSQTTSQIWSWKSLQKGMGAGLKSALISGGIAALAANLLFLGASHGNLSYSLPRSLGFGLFVAMEFGITTLLSTSLRQQEHNRPMTKRKWTSRVLDGISISACNALGFGVITTIQEGLPAALLYTLIISITSFFFGMTGGQSLIRIGEIKTAETVAWSWQNIQQHIAEDMTKGAMIGLSITILIFFILSIASGLFYGPDYGIPYGIIYGIICGCIVGIISLLTTILNRGWESSMLSEDQLAQPNEGIRRSLRHSIFAGLLFGPIGGFAFGLIGGLSGWPLLAVGLSIVFTIILTLQFALIRGGIACIEHALLRWFLWRKRSIPLYYIRFLNYAARRILLRRIGGGYIFIHRMFLDYFASLEDAP